MISVDFNKGNTMKHDETRHFSGFELTSEPLMRRCHDHLVSATAIASGGVNLHTSVGEIEAELRIFRFHLRN